jgi:GDPmannose 4,6-dehydratase
MFKKQKVALICGVNGQDGALLAKFLLRNGYIVYGTSRDHVGSNLANLKSVGILGKVKVLTMSPLDFRSIILAFEHSQCDEVYYLAGQSSVGHSFIEPAQTLESTIIGTLNILEAAKMVKWDPRLYFAGSSESFGDTNGSKATEDTPFNPVSPYAVAKASSTMLVANYREAYGMFACTGILFNHESALRPKRFVTQKIIHGALGIYQGQAGELELGRLDVVRDWGCAEEYVVAMWKMLQQTEPKDFVISTGESHSLRDFVSHAFSLLNLKWENYVRCNDNLMRPSEIMVSVSNPQKAQLELGWKAEKTMFKVVEDMMFAAQQIK